jgi:TRAP-type C4-dicarboxylate transport system substrate-binding protein
MRQRLQVLAAALAVGGLCGWAPAARADERRIATLAPEGSLWMKMMKRGAAEIETQTGGRIKTKYYGGGTQGDERDVVRKIRLKQLDGAAFTSMGLALIYPGIRVLQLPSFYDSVEEVDYVREKMWPYFQEKFAAEGFELLAAGDVGWIYLFSTKPIASRDDLKKTKIWMWQGDPQANHLFDRMGLNGVPLGLPEVLAALQTGRIEACFGSPLAAVALQWHTKIRYMASLPVGYGIGGMVMRQEVWNRASDEDRQVQMEIGRNMMVKTIRRVRKDNERALVAMKKQGIQLLTTPEAVAEDFEREGRALWDAWVGEVYSKEELAMVLEVRAEYRKQHPAAKTARGAAALP